LTATPSDDHRYRTRYSPCQRPPIRNTAQAVRCTFLSRGPYEVGLRGCLHHQGHRGRDKRIARLRRRDGSPGQRSGRACPQSQRGRRHFAAGRVPDAVPPRPAPCVADGRAHPRASLCLRPVRSGADTMAAPHPCGHAGAVVDDVPRPAARRGRHPVNRGTQLAVRVHARAAPRLVTGSAVAISGYGENACPGGRQSLPSMRSCRTSMAFLPCLRAVSM
jgi:hypothetical protein